MVSISTHLGGDNRDQCQIELEIKNKNRQRLL